MKRNLSSLFAFLDEEWLKITPDAVRIRSKLAALGEHFENDHVALRTFDDARVNIATLSQPFLDAGYQSSGRYVFDAKMLNAESFRPPAGSNHPHVFISELDRSRVPAPLKDLVDATLQSLDSLPAGAAERAWALLSRERGWHPPTHAQYTAAAQHSEYAAWLWAYGICANHFTVSVNALARFDSVSAVNAWLLGEGFSLNGAPPYIQGRPGDFLVQSSTVAKQLPFEFACGHTAEIPSCYVEFAQRFVAEDGHLFDGFVTQSADKIFESTARSSSA